MNRGDVTARWPAHVAQPTEDYLMTASWPTGFSHTALLYADEQEYLRWTALVAEQAARAAAPLHVLVPASAMNTMRQVLGGPRRRLLVADMTELGRNPARIIAAGLAFADAHPGQHIYCLWEPAWTGRSTAEMREVARHEALCNLAFSQRAMTMLCLYDAAGLCDPSLVNARRTHPAIIAAGRRQASGTYAGPGRVPPGCDDPLPPPAGDPESLGFGRDLRSVRTFCFRQAHSAGLPPERATDFVLAVSEIAANALGHGGGHGTIQCWCTTGELLCEVQDAGQITDPLAGRHYEPPESAGGHGLWVTNRLCDLVETRTGPAGTVTRLHMRRGPAGGQAGC